MTTQDTITMGLTDKSINLIPMDDISGFDVRPGFYRINGATAIPCGVNFTIHSHQATSIELLLFHRGESEHYASLEFPQNYKIGNVYAMIVFNINIEEFEYAYRVKGPRDYSRGIIFDESKYLLDPYAKAVVGQSVWSSDTRESHYRARVVRNDFDWGNFKQASIPLKDLIIYEIHTRGFTMDPSSKVEHRGTFSGLLEKIPYLKELGINCIELMPIFEFDEMQGKRDNDGKPLLDYWGYNSVCFFAPNTSYAASSEFNKEGLELKNLIKTLNENGIEVILDVVFNHTAEGNEMGPYISFKGFDNNIYYMLTADGKYFNFSGCGNTLNCNHPIVQNMILECLRYWVIEYRVSGFRFDLASILGRNEDGTPMNSPPLLQRLAFDPILGGIKLIAEAWDAGGLYQVGSFPSWNRWAEWNGKYRDDMRSFLKGDTGCIKTAADRIVGSTDLYNLDYRGDNVSVNFLTCHDGFTLYDLYAYNMKHNEANGWDSTDGTDDNRSWNCGIEGETEDEKINALRKRMILNACLTLLCSRGTPMFLAGDEFCNTQFGNNNAYCQDNEISWLDWSFKNKHSDVFEFFKKVIAFRKGCKIIRGRTKPAICGLPDVSIHSNIPWEQNYQSEDKALGVMLAGFDDEKNKDEIVYIAINTYWESINFVLPSLKDGLYWKEVFNTYAECERLKNAYNTNCTEFNLEGRSVALFTAMND